MSKAILLSIKPKYVAKILNGEKTIEIRKTIPKCDLPIDVYIYCTKDLKNGKEALTWLNEKALKQVKNITYNGKELLGKVVAKFTLRNIEEIKPFDEYNSPFGLAYKLTEEKIITCQKAQLTYDEYNRYLKDKTGYAYHIEDLVIFDRPKELWEFNSFNGIVPCNKCHFQGVSNCECNHCNSLYKAPQNYCYVESEE